MKYKLLYVCYNNKGRSPALQAFTRYFLEKRDIEGIAVESAGAGVEHIEKLRKQSGQLSRMTRHIMRHDYGIDLDNMSIKHLGEVGSKWDAVLAADRDTVEFINDGFPQFSEKTVLAKEYAGYSHKHSMEIHGPYHYHHQYREQDWTERLGYDIMLNECKNVARRVAKTFI